MKYPDAMNDILANLDRMIADAPESTEEEQRAFQEKWQNEQKAAARLRALGPLTGWPEKYLDATQTPPEGKEWLLALGVALERVKKSGIVVFYGIRGSGKTRMAAELAIHTGTSRYRTAMRFFLEIRATFRKGSSKSEIEIIDDLVKADLLILDEIQERGETDFEDRLLTHLIDARYSACKPTILIANLGKKELAAALGNSIVDRARENGKSIHFDWPSYRSMDAEQ